MYDIDVPGYQNGCNRLHLFDLDSVDDSIVGNDGINFDKKDIRRNLTLFLYPDDSDSQGQLLRIYQQYFMVSNAAQLILKECADRGVDLHKPVSYTHLADGFYTAGNHDIADSSRRGGACAAECAGQLL